MSGKKVVTGRPLSITPAVVGKLVDIFRLGVTDTLACSHAGISRDTFYDHLERDPSFADEMASAKNYARIAAGQVVVQDIKKGNVDSAKWWLEKKHSDEFGSKGEGKINVSVIQQFNDGIKNKSTELGLDDLNKAQDAESPETAEMSKVQEPPTDGEGQG